MFYLFGFQQFSYLAVKIRSDSLGFIKNIVFGLGFGLGGSSGNTAFANQNLVFTESEELIDTFCKLLHGERGFETTFTMEQFAESINKFLTFREYKILVGKGRISGRTAKAKAEAEYDIFNKTQRITSDFDREIRKLLESK